MKVINRIQKTMFCPLCGETHMIDVVTKESNTLIKGEVIVFPKTVYVCYNSEENENEFIPAGVMDSNLMAARDAYRQAHHMLTSREIVALRKRYGLSQKELARMLGWGDVTISRYESKYIQDKTHDDLLKMVSEDPLSARKYLLKNKDRFLENRFNDILTEIDKAVSEAGAVQYRKKSLEAMYSKYATYDNLTGRAEFNLSKICGMIDYFARNCENLFKVKLMKLLWYADTLSYKKYNHAISGLVYQHKPMGALPVGHYELIALVPHEEIPQEEAVSYRILPFESIQYTVLSEEEVKILETVAKKFSSFNGIVLADYMHKEVAYTQTAENAFIPYSFADRLSIS